jgi:hypothetical protein
MAEIDGNKLDITTLPVAAPPGCRFFFPASHSRPRGRQHRAEPESQELPMDRAIIRAGSAISY